MSIVTQRIYTGDSIVYVGENGGGGGMSKVEHDATLTGDGTYESPLSAIRGVWGVTAFTSDTDITGVWVSGTLTATAGTLYKGTAISALTLALVAQEGGEYHIKFSTASTIGTFNFSAVTSWIGDAPTVAASKTYEIDILDGVGICAEAS